MTDTVREYSDFIARYPDEELPDGAESCSAVVCLAVPGTPVIYVSAAFEAHTGYSAEEAIGRSLSFLQGPETEPAAIARFRELIETQSAGSVSVTNYRRDGSRFQHVCELRPVHGSDGRVSHFVAVQRPAARR